MNNSNQNKNGTSKNSKSKSKTFLKPVEELSFASGASKKELNQKLNKIGKVKGKKKEEYIAELVDRSDAILFAADLLKVLNSVITLNHKLDEQIVRGYQKNIEKLMTRLDKLNGDKDDKEITMIYNQISDLTRNIQQIHNDWHKIIGVIILGVFSLAGIVTKDKLDKR